MIALDTDRVIAGNDHRQATTLPPCGKHVCVEKQWVVGFLVVLRVVCSLKNVFNNEILFIMYSIGLKWGNMSVIMK